MSQTQVAKAIVLILVCLLLATIGFLVYKFKNVQIQNQTTYNKVQTATQVTHTPPPATPTLKPKTFRALPSTTTAGKLLYQDTTLGYAFEYPQNQTIEPDYSIVFINGLGIALYQIQISTKNTESDLAHNTYIPCAADEPMGSLYTNEQSIVIKSYVNPKEFNGFQIDFTCTAESYNTNGTSSTQTKPNTIYAYHLPHTTDQYIMIYMFNIFDKYNPNQLRKIADSFTLLPESQ